MMTANEYTIRLSDLLRSEHEALADFLVELAEFDRLFLWREAGYGSLFDYLHRELGLSRGAAHYRKVAADLIQRFPEILEPIRDGRLCFSSVLELARVITTENRAEILPRFFNRSKAEAKMVAAEIRPAEIVPSREIVTVARPAPMRSPVAPPNPPPTPDSAARGQIVHLDELELAPSASAPPPRDERATIEPLTAELARLHITVSKRFLSNLDRARDALSHSNPGASIAEILEAGLDLILDRAAKRRGLVEKPQTKLRPARLDRVRASVVREVWKRDQGRCQYRMPNGEICGCTEGLEVHHLNPRARGGGHTAKDLVLLCKPHHRVVTREQFGDDWIDACIRSTRRGRRPAPPRASSGQPLRADDPAARNERNRSTAAPTAAANEPLAEPATMSAGP